MEFDKNRVYTALNADELKVGSKVIVADNLETLIYGVTSDNEPKIITDICHTGFKDRFEIDTARYNLCYLISEPEEKKLKWTDLKIGDVIRYKDDYGTINREVIGIDDCNVINHIVIYDGHVSDAELEEWEKVEE